MTDLISRQAAIDWLKNEWDGMVTSVFKGIENLPSAQPEPITVNIDHELTQEECEKLRKDISNAPIMLSPSAQQWTPCSEGVPEDEYVLISKKLSKISGDKKTGTNVPQQPTQPPMPPRGGSAAHKPAQTVKIGVETEGLDEATAKIETLADALDGFPPQVQIKNCRDCTINIYPSQIRSVEGDES